MNYLYSMINETNRNHINNHYNQLVSLSNSSQAITFSWSVYFHSFCIDINMYLFQIIMDYETITIINDIVMGEIKDAL